MGTAVWISIAVVVVLVVLLVLYLWVTRNALVALRARVDEAWSDITAQRRRRGELLPPLLAAVGTYAAPHDETAFGSLRTARDETLAASGPADASVAEAHWQQAVRSVFGVADHYPQLQASTDFLALKGDLVDVEERIQSSRRFYNGGVREFNTKIRVFPNSLFARRLGFGPREFFETSSVAAVSEPPRIQF